MTELEKVSQNRHNMLKTYLEKKFSAKCLSQVCHLFTTYAEDNHSSGEALAERITSLIKESKTEAELPEKIKTIKL